MDITITQKQKLRGTLSVPGDKSISHRSVMFGAIAKGITEIHGFLLGEDCLSTISCFRKLGISIEMNDSTVIVHGKGLHGLSAPKETLDVGNSGTTLRLITGLLAAQNFSSKLTGDSSIQKRPMNRVARPLGLMDACFEGKNNENLYAPFTIHGKQLKGIEYTLPVASAQVKSALLLAGLYAQGETIIEEPEPTRDHTEIMLNYMGANIEQKGNIIFCHPISELYGKKIEVPGDISSAAYFIVAGCICPDSEILIQNVGLNPTRTGIIDILIKMGATISIQNEKVISGEKVGDVFVKSSQLTGCVIGGKDIPRLIDEIPVLAVAACFANGTTRIQDASELKVKESNRIQTVVTELKKFGATIKETEDGMEIQGGATLSGCTVESYNDHRIAMSMAIAGIMAKGETTITNSNCANISFPSFFDLLTKL